jgi:hypothetical protein
MEYRLAVVVAVVDFEGECWQLGIVVVAVLGFEDSDPAYHRVRGNL